nr:K467 [uncultured bacterium]
MHKFAVAVIDTDVTDAAADAEKQQVTDLQRGCCHRLSNRFLGADIAWQVESEHAIAVMHQATAVEAFLRPVAACAIRCADQGRRNFGRQPVALIRGRTGVRLVGPQRRMAAAGQTQGRHQNQD